MKLSSRMIRKQKAILQKLKLLPTQWQSDHSSPEQHRRFLELSPYFAEQYQSVAALENAEFMTPLWQAFNARLRQTLLPTPAWDFLRDPVISSTMVMTKGGPTLAAELEYLEAHYPSDRLGEILGEDPVGRPTIMNKSYRTSHNNIHHAYHLARFSAATKIDLGAVNSVIEWGGGYGNLAKLWGRAAGPIPTYKIIDTPLLCTLQWLYLASILGPQAVHLAKNSTDIREEGICLIPTSLASKINLQSDLLISTWAISESSPVAQKFVLDRNWFGAKHLLLGYQDSNPHLPNASDIGKAAQASGAQVSDLPSMPGQHYAFR